MRWSLFFLIATGRGRTLFELPAEGARFLMNWIYDVAALLGGPRTLDWDAIQRRARAAGGQRMLRLGLRVSF